MASREERERAQLAALKAKYEAKETAPKRGRRPRPDDDDDDAGEVMVFTGRKASRFLDSLTGGVRDLLGVDDDDEDQDDDDDQGDDDQGDDDQGDPGTDAPPRQHGFYRDRRRRN